jgi:hypothetical protein
MRRVIVSEFVSLDGVIEDPGGSGKYNNHPIGVWYDRDRSKWAIFNQDRAAMPVGADFNVAVLKEPTQAR